MIDINELRQLAQAATHIDTDLCGDRYFTAQYSIATLTKEQDGFITAANPTAITELLDRLEAAEKERDTLRAEVEQMEQQEPVAWMLNCQTLGGDTGWILSWTQSGAGLCNRLSGEENEKKLYALPGAKGETK